MIDYRVHPEQRLIRITARGTDNTCEMLQEHWGRLYRDPQYDAAFHHLFVIAEDAAGPIENEMIRLRSMLELMAESQPVSKKWAVILPSTWKRIFVETVLRGIRLGRVQLRFFALEEDALRWLAVLPPGVNYEDRPRPEAR